MCERRKRTTDENATGRGDRTKYFRMCVSACVNPKIRWKVRYAIDYRKLNSVTKMDVYPLPLVEDFLDTNHTSWLLIVFRILGIVQKPTLDC
jgi:hypothetical protein